MSTWLQFDLAGHVVLLDTRLVWLAIIAGWALWLDQQNRRGRTARCVGHGPTTSVGAP
jgi:hypothetical protein